MASFHLFTNCWGFLQAPLDQVVERVCEWKAELKIKLKRTRSHRLHRFESDLAGALQYFEPFRDWKTLYLNTDSNWTAVLCSKSNSGSSPQSEVGYLSRQLNCRGVLLTAVEDSYDENTNRGQYGGYQLVLYADEARPGEIRNDRRVIGAINSGSRWEFFQEGPEQPFEKPDYYKARRVRDRFTDEILEEYCQALGIRLFDPDFYGPQCALFAPESLKSDSSPPLTFADIRADLGLE